MLIIQVVNCKVGGLRSQKDAGLFALVTMETEKDVQVCVAKLNETNFNGKQIVVAKVNLPRMMSSLDFAKYDS